jgi:hypothetical protein
MRAREHTRATTEKAKTRTTTKTNAKSQPKKAKSADASPAAAANASVFRTYADALDPAKARVVSNILRVFHGRWKDHGATQPSDWLDNDIAGFWSPSYRNALNERGTRIFDEVSRQLSDEAHGGCSSVDLAVLFLFRQDLEALGTFLACVQRSSCNTTLYAVRQPERLRGLLKETKVGGANSNGALQQYAHGLRFPARVAAVRDLLAKRAPEDRAGDRHAAYLLARDLGVADGVELLVSDEVLEFSPERIVRHLLGLPARTVLALIRR